MKNRNKLIIAGIILMLVGIAWAVYFILNRNQGDTALSILDKRWIENNKDQIVDIAVLNNLPIYGYEGKGVFFEFIKDLETDTGLEFNKVPYVIGNTPSLGEYVYKILDTNVKPNKNQLLLHEDVYIVLSKSNNKFTRLSDINGYNIGALNEDIALVSLYFTDSNNLTYKPYQTSDLLFDALNKDEINLIVIPYNLYLNTILATDDYHVAFHLNEISKQYVLELSKDNDRLNNIITKYYAKWKEDKQSQIYNDFLFESYLVNRNIDSATRNEFQGKRYNYGVVNYLPYEMILDDELIGINGEYLNLFSDITNVEFKLLEYKNIDELNEAIASGKVDISFNYFNTSVTKDYSKTISPYDEEYVLLAQNNQNIVVNSLKAIKNKVHVLKNTLLCNYVKKISDIDVVEYKTITDLFNNLDAESLTLIDSDVYNNYSKTKFSNYKIIFRGRLNQNYTFLLKNSKDNQVFNDLFNKFLTSVDHKIISSKANIKLLANPIRQNFLETLSKYILIIIVMTFFFVRFTVSLLTKQRVQKKLKKEAKLRYTDMLTALKNRNYLNDHIEEWEANSVYPQAIVIVDLNNVKYVNDNYGHEEGDNLIKKAASILINTQLENSEIIRTDGNEFLLYLIGYDEQQVVLYTRKLYKELKGLPHEFGAAVGFSMIEDDIKTIDDAINEATLDMRTNKEGQKE